MTPEQSYPTPGAMDRQVEAYLVLYGRSSLRAICEGFGATDVTIVRALMRLQACGRVVREMVGDQAVYGLRDNGGAA